MSIIFWLLLGYFIYRSVGNLFEVTRPPAQFNAPSNRGHQTPPFQKFNEPKQQIKPNQGSGWRNNQADIEDAEWEELD